MGRKLTVWLIVAGASACGGKSGPADGARPSDGVRRDAPPLVDGKPSCGDPAVLARLPACKAAADQAACAAAGGSWRQAGLGARLMCICPTGQAGCACTSASECGGRCMVPVGGGSCANVTSYTCTAETPVFGCFCLPGSSAGLCID
jgi:hypothetical protein